MKCFIKAKIADFYFLSAYVLFFFNCTSMYTLCDSRIYGFVFFAVYTSYYLWCVFDVHIRSVGKVMKNKICYLPEKHTHTCRWHLHLRFHLCIVRWWCIAFQYKRFINNFFSVCGYRIYSFFRLLRKILYRFKICVSDMNFSEFKFWVWKRISNLSGMGDLFFFRINKAIIESVYLLQEFGKS